MRRSVIFSLISILLVSVLIAGCGDPSPEQKKTELQKSVEAVSAQLKQLDEITAFWKDTWTGLGTGKINRAEGKERMDFIFKKAMESSGKITSIEAPKWMQKEASDKFKKMIDDYNLAANTLASAAQKASPLLTKDRPSQFEIDTVMNEIKDYQKFIMSGAVGYAAFKNGYGLDQENKK